MSGKDEQPQPKQEAKTPAESPASPGNTPINEEKTPMMCRALVLMGYGGYDKIKLQVKAMPKHDLKSGEVLVRVKACGLNFAELMGRQGLYDPLPSPPVIMGMEGAGVVEAVGPEVEDKKGNDVLLSVFQCCRGHSIQGFNMDLLAVRQEAMVHPDLNLPPQE